MKMGTPKIFYEFFLNSLSFRAFVWSKSLFALWCIPNFVWSEINVGRIWFLMDSTVLSLLNIFEINCILSLEGWSIVSQHQIRFPSILFIAIRTGMIRLHKNGFFVIHLGVSGCKVSQSVSKLNIVLFDVSRFYSLIIWILFIELLLVICIVASIVLISENYVIKSDIFCANRLLSAFDLVIWKSVFKLRFVSCIIYVVLIPNTKVVFPAILIAILMIIKFVLRVLGNVFRGLLC
jgi:hypothetical protein